MRETRYETQRYTPVVRSDSRRDGMAAFTAPAPTYHSHTTGYPYGGATRKAAGSGRRTVALGLTTLALIAVGFGVTAYLRTQEAATTAAPIVAAQSVPLSVYAQQVPMAGRMTVPASVVAQQVPTALAAQAMPLSVYAQQVPLAGRITVPASVVAQQVPTAVAPIAVTVPHAAMAELAATMARTGPMVPASVVAQQVPMGARAELADTLADGRSLYEAQVPLQARQPIPGSVLDSQVPELAR